MQVIDHLPEQADLKFSNSEWIFLPGSQGYEQILEVLGRYQYHWDLSTVTGDTLMEEVERSVTLTCGEDRIVFSGKKKVVLNGVSCRVGYWGDGAGKSLLREVSAILEQQEETVS